MSWALILEGRADPAAIILLLDDRDEAEIIAREVCRNGTRMVVRPYPGHELVTGLSSSHLVRGSEASP